VLKGWHKATRKERWLLIAATLGWAIILTFPTVFIVNNRPVFDNDFLRDVYLTAALSTILLSTFVVLTLWTRLISPLKSKSRFHSGRALGLSFLLVICATILPSIAVAAASPLLDAKVCSAGGYDNIGLFIGQTKDAIYMGEREPFEGHRRILAVPLAKTEQVFLGPKSRVATCDQELNAQSFVDIVDRLGNSNMDVRVGAIFAFGRIADSTMGEPYRRSIVRMISSYIRGHSAWPGRCEATPAELKTIEQLEGAASRFLPELQNRAPDVDAAIRTIEDWAPEIREDVVVDLQGVDLRKAVLNYADLHGVLLSQAHLELAKLYQANLNGAALVGTKLTGAILSKADLRGASLFSADLRSADLSQVLIDDHTDFKGAIANAKTRWPTHYDASAAKAAGVHFEDSRSGVLVCAHIPTQK
jgi:hypothetical protein